MKHKKAKDYIEVRVKEEGIPAEDITDMVNMYWKEIRDALEKLKYIRIVVPGLGTFKTRYNRVEKARKEQQAHILEKGNRLIYKNPLGKNKLVVELDKLEQYKKILQWWELEYEHKAEVTKRKKEYKENKLRNNDTIREDTKGLGEQNTDS